jgi:hypothetical protein
MRDLKLSSKMLRLLFCMANWRRRFPHKKPRRFIISGKKDLVAN